jgi:hypothetical protein
MQGALDNAAKDPDNFGIAPEEMQRRRSFVSQTRAGANSIRDTLAAAKSVKSARKERMERQGLLAGRGSSSCEMASGKLYLLWPYSLWHYLLWLYYYGSTYYGSSSCEMASGAVVVVVVVVEPQ